MPDSEYKASTVPQIPVNPLQDSFQDFISLYKRSPSGIRYQLLRHFADHISPSDFNYLLALEPPSSREMRFDFIERLPRELAIQVLCEINPEDVLDLRVVCKRWDQLITSNDFSLRALLRWMPYIHRSILAREPWYIKCGLPEDFSKISWRRVFFTARNSTLRLMRGKPLRIMPLPHVWGIVCDYLADRLIGWPSDGWMSRETVLLCDLAEDTKVELRAEHCESFVDFQLSDFHAAGITELGYLYAWDFETLTRKCIRLPNSNGTLLGEGHVFTVLPFVPSDQTLVWEVDKNKLHAFPTMTRMSESRLPAEFTSPSGNTYPRPDDLSPHYKRLSEESDVVIDLARECLIDLMYLEAEQDDKLLIFISFLRTSYTGVPLTSSHTVLERPLETPRKPIRVRTGANQRSFTVVLCTSSPRTTVAYDLRTEALQVEEWDVSRLPPVDNSHFWHSGRWGLAFPYSLRAEDGLAKTLSRCMGDERWRIFLPRNWDGDGEQIPDEGLPEELRKVNGAALIDLGKIEFVDPAEEGGMEGVESTPESG